MQKDVSFGGIRSLHLPPKHCSQIDDIVGVTSQKRASSEG